MREDEEYVICIRSDECDAEMIGTGKPEFRCLSCCLMPAAGGDSESADLVLRSGIEAEAHLREHQMTKELRDAAASRIDFVSVNSQNAFRKLRAYGSPFIDSVLDRWRNGG